MIKFFLFFLFIFFNIITVNATLNLNPGRVYFNIEPSEKHCEDVTVSSSDYTGDIEIKDVWAQSTDEGSNLNDYTLTSKYYNLEIYYKNAITNLQSEEKINVCITSSDIGEFKGALIFYPEAESNVRVAVATWLIVSAKERVLSAQSNNQQNTGDSGGGSPNKNSQINVNAIVEGENEVAKEEIVEEVNYAEEEVQEITTKAVKETEEKEDEKEKKESYYKILGLIILLAIIGSLLVIGIYVRNKKRKAKWV